jgi:hypothetical protein
LQSAHPGAHAPSHWPPEHAGLGTWFAEHLAPHPPQFPGSVSTFVSQPSVCLLLLQSANPGAHVPSQIPIEHAGVMSWLEQTTLQPPQFATSPWVFVSQPSVCLLALQSANPGAQVPVQTPAVHVGIGTLLFEHAFPHAPQLPGSELTSRHCPVQQTLEDGQAWAAVQPGTQAPDAQSEPAGQPLSSVHPASEASGTLPVSAASASASAPESGGGTTGPVSASPASPGDASMGGAETSAAASSPVTTSGCAALPQATPVKASRQAAKTVRIMGTRSRRRERWGRCSRWSNLRGTRSRR